MGSEINNAKRQGMREAIADLLIPGAYSFAVSESYPEVSPGQRVFPPQDSGVLSVIGTYVKLESEERTPIPYAFMNPDIGSEILKVLEMYEHSQGILYSRGQHVEQLLQFIPNLRDVENTKLWYQDKVVNSKRRLLSAHVVTRGYSNGEYNDAVVVPSVIMEQVPLVVRNFVTLNLSEVLEHASELSGQKKDSYLGMIRRITSLDESLSTWSSAFASFFLPKPEELSLLIETQDI